KTLEALGARRATFAVARHILTQGWVRTKKRVFDNTKISDRFVIIPTLKGPRELMKAEQKLYDLVVRRFLAVFYPAAEFLQTTRITRIGEQHFKTEGRVLQSAGWLVVYGRSVGDEEQNLPPIEQGEKVKVVEVDERANQTKPPPR